MRKFLFLFVIGLASGCACVNTVSVKVSEPRPAIPVKDVQLALMAPTNSVYLADIFAEANNSAQGANAAQADLKEKAAAIGANVLVIEMYNQDFEYSPMDGRFRVEGKAYFVPSP
jgi:hypothetical protein